MIELEKILMKEYNKALVIKAIAEWVHIVSTALLVNCLCSLLINL